MNDVYEQQLVHELEIHARTEAPDAGLVDRLLARAVIRRRRRRTVLVSVTAVVAVALALVAGAGSVLYQSNRKTPPAKDHRASTSAALHIAYAVNGTKAANGTWSPTVVQLPDPGSVRATLPDHWSVERLERSGSGYLLWVRIVPSSKFAEFMAYLSPSGELRTLSHVDPSSVPLDRNGDVWLSGRPNPGGLTRPPEPNGVELVRPASDTVVGSQSGIPSTRVVAAVGGDSVLVRNDVGHVQVWPLSGPARPGKAIDTRGTPWFLVGVAPDGRLLVRAPRQLHLFDSDGREQWTWDRPADLRWDGNAPASFSPDGRYVVARLIARYTPGGYRVLDASNGTLVSDSPAGVVRTRAWEDSRTLIADDGEHLERCDLLRQACVALDVPSSVLVAGELGPIQVGPAAPSP